MKCFKRRPNAYSANEKSTEALVILVVVAASALCCLSNGQSNVLEQLRIKISKNAKTYLDKQISKQSTHLLTL